MGCDDGSKSGGQKPPAEGELVLGVDGEALQLLNALLLLQFLLVLKVADPFEEFHEIDVVADLLRLVQDGVPVVPMLPVYLLDVVLDVVQRDGQDALLVLQLVEVVGD